MNDIIEATQLVTTVHNQTLSEWVQGYNTLVKMQDYQRGYYHYLAKSKCSDFKQYCVEIGVTVQHINKLIQHYKEVKELSEIAPEKPYPKQAEKSKLLRGTTPEEKADSYIEVIKQTRTEDPTVKQVKEVVAGLNKTVETVTPFKKSLRNELQNSNLKEILNEENNNIIIPEAEPWYTNYSGPTVEALSDIDKLRIQEIEDKLHSLYDEAVALFPYYSPQL